MAMGGRGDSASPLGRPAEAGPRSQARANRFRSGDPALRTTPLHSENRWRRRAYEHSDGSGIEHAQSAEHIRQELQIGTPI